MRPHLRLQGLRNVDSGFQLGEHEAAEDDRGDMGKEGPRGQLSVYPRTSSQVPSVPAAASKEGWAFPPHCLCVRASVPSTGVQHSSSMKAALQQHNEKRLTQNALCGSIALQPCRGICWNVLKGGTKAARQRAMGCLRGILHTVTQQPACSLFWLLKYWSPSSANGNSIRE